MSFLKDNGGVIGVGIIIISFIVGYSELRLPNMIDQELSSRGLVSTDKITEIEKDITEQKETHKDDRDRLDGKIERIVDILLEDG